LDTHPDADPNPYPQSYNELKDGVAAGSTLGILVDFLYLFVASLALGMLFGLGTAFLLKFLHSDSSPQEARAAASVKTSCGVTKPFIPQDLPCASGEYVRFVCSSELSMPADPCLESQLSGTAHRAAVTYTGGTDRHAGVPVVPLRRAAGHLGHRLAVLLRRHHLTLCALLKILADSPSDTSMLQRVSP